MAIRPRNKKKLDFNSTSMADLVFLLLIFFMLTSTLVSPNAIKLLMPSSSSKTIAKQSLNVYINAERRYFVEKKEVSPDELEANIAQMTAGQTDASIVLRVDMSVSAQDMVNVYDAVIKINAKNNTKHKLILATKPTN